MKLTQKQNKIISQYQYYKNYQELSELDSMIIDLCFIFFSTLAFVFIAAPLSEKNKIIGDDILIFIIGIIIAACVIWYGAKSVHDDIMRSKKLYIKHIDDENERLFKNKKTKLIQTIINHNKKYVLDYISDNFLLNFEKHLNTFTIKENNTLICTDNYIGRNSNGIAFFDQESKTYHLILPSDIVKIHTLLMKETEFKINYKLETEPQKEYLSNNINYYNELITLNETNHKLSNDQRKIIMLYEKICKELVDDILEYVQKTYTKNLLNIKKNQELVYLAENLIRKHSIEEGIL